MLERLLGRSPGSVPGAEARQDGERLERVRVEHGPALEGRDLPRAAVVILNYNGRHHLGPCFDSLRAMDYPADRLEVVLVDNGSEDGSLEELRGKHGWVKLLANRDNVGFSKGCNQGAAAADAPDVLVFLNNDMRVEPSWLRELVSPVVRGECQASTAKMLSWDGKLMNSAGGGMNFYGIGIQKGYLEPPGPEFDVPGRSLFACGGAMAIDAEVFFRSGGFDEEFFAYYEDVDLGWRLWVQGHEVHYVPTAVCYHHHSSTSRTFPVETVRLLQVRNPVLACFKNYDDAHLAQVLPAQLALAMRRMFLASGLETGPFRIEEVSVQGSGVVGRLRQKARKSLREKVGVHRIAAADLVGLNDLLGDWDHWMERRQAVQRERRRPDEEIFQLFHKPMWCIEDDPGYRQLQAGASAFFGIEELFKGLTQAGAKPHK